MANGALYTLRPAEVYAALATSPDGLSTGEVAARRGLYGENVLLEEAASRAWQRFLGHMVHPFAWLLWIAGGISFLVGEPSLGVVIWILVVVNAGFSYWREHRTEQAMQALRQLLPSNARLVREGKEVSTSTNEIVPGDILILAEGDSIPADARIVEAFGLRINNAVLTGEAVPARKTSDASLRQGISEIERPNLVFAGTSVVSGTGRAVVYSTGMRTQFGRIAHLTQVVEETPSHFQDELVRITRVIAIIALALGAIVFVVGAFQLGLDRYAAFLLALGILVAAVPEGLPAMITLTLAMAGQRLAQRGVLVKKLSVIETLGTVSTICADKSGTLTQNQMTVREIWVSGRHLSVSGGGYEPVGRISPDLPNEGGQDDLDWLLRAAILCNNSRLSPPSDLHPRWTALGDQTEAALRVAALKGQIDEVELAEVLPRIHELPFEARRKRMSTIHRIRQGARPDWIEQLAGSGPGALDSRREVAFVKGAPREVLQLCRYILLDGEVHTLEDRLRAEIVAANDGYARRGLRVLALGFRFLPQRAGPYTPKGVECDLIFLGLMAMLDPARPEVAEAVRICKQAGIRIVMITGDYGLTAESLARRTGMLSSREALIVTGAELNAMDEAGLSSLLEKEVVFARMAPEHKLRLVTAFQRKGEVVAVTGDGVNDAPALRKADIGVAMGWTGTDVAKEAADIVLVNDNFATITNAIAEGRAVYDNLRKFLTYIFSSNVPEVLPFILTAWLNIPLALTVLQILAIDLGTDVLPGLALGSEKPEPDVMLRPPRRREQPLVDRQLIWRAFAWLGLIETGLAYSGFFLVYHLAGSSGWIPAINFRGSDLPVMLQWLNVTNVSATNAVAVTTFHAGVVMAQVGNAFACRSEVQCGSRLGWLSNRFLIVGVLVEIALIVLLIYVDPLASIFGHAALPSALWLWLAVYPFALYGLEWIRKAIVRKLSSGAVRVRS